MKMFPLFWTQMLHQSETEDMAAVGVLVMVGADLESTITQHPALPSSPQHPPPPNLGYQKSFSWRSVEPRLLDAISENYLHTRKTLVCSVILKN